MNNNNIQDKLSVPINSAIIENNTFDKENSKLENYLKKFLLQEVKKELNNIKNIEYYVFYRLSKNELRNILYEITNEIIKKLEKFNYGSYIYNLLKNTIDEIINNYENDVKYCEFLEKYLLFTLETKLKENSLNLNNSTDKDLIKILHEIRNNNKYFKIFRINDNLVKRLRNLKKLTNISEFKEIDKIILKENFMPILEKNTSFFNLTNNFQFNPEEFNRLYNEKEIKDIKNILKKEVEKEKTLKNYDEKSLKLLLEKIAKNNEITRKYDEPYMISIIDEITKEFLEKDKNLNLNKKENIKKVDDEIFINNKSVPLLKLNNNEMKKLKELTDEEKANATKKLINVKKNKNSNLNKKENIKKINDESFKNNKSIPLLELNNNEIGELKELTDKEKANATEKLINVTEEVWESLENLYENKNKTEIKKLLLEILDSNSIIFTKEEIEYLKDAIENDKIRNYKIINIDDIDDYILNYYKFKKFLNEKCKREISDIMLLNNFKQEQKDYNLDDNTYNNISNILENEKNFENYAIKNKENNTSENYAIKNKENNISENYAIKNYEDFEDIHQIGNDIFRDEKDLKKSDVSISDEITEEKKQTALTKFSANLNSLAFKIENLKENSADVNKDIFKELLEDDSMQLEYQLDEKEKKYLKKLIENGTILEILERFLD